MSFSVPVMVQGTMSPDDIQSKSTPGTSETNSRIILTDMKSYTVEKEMLESHLRKLKLENSTLQMENKLLKDKHLRATTLALELESKLQETQTEISELQAKVDEQSKQLKLKVTADTVREMEQHKARATTAAKEVEILKSEMFSQEEQLNIVRKELEMMRQNMNRSKIHDIYKQEIETFKNEVAHLKHLLEESDLALEAESTRCRALAEQVKKYSEVKEFLHRQIEAGSSWGSAAEKQVVSLEMRLRVTEERLAQERADRAGNVSQIEEKLLLENSKMHTKTKELERKLKREKQKTRILEQRSNGFREENIQLRLVMPDEDEKNYYNIPYMLHLHQRLDNKKLEYDIKQVLTQLEAETGHTDGNLLILHLWENREKLQHKVKEWNLYLEQLELPTQEEEGVNALQSALMLKAEYETKLQQTEEKFEDISAEKITAEQAYKKQLSDLVKERHEAYARLKTMEDLMDALRAENESLRQGLATPLDYHGVKQGTSVNGQLDVLLEQIAGLDAKIGQLTRRNKILEADISLARNQLELRDKELTETFAELKVLQSPPKSILADEQLQQQRIQSLVSEIAVLKEEMHLQSERNCASQQEKNQLKTELTDVKDQLRSAKKQNREQEQGLRLSQRNQIEKLETEIEGRNEEILKLTTSLNESEALLATAQTELLFLKKTLKDLEARMESMQYQLDERCQVLDALMTRENNQLDQLDMVKGMIHTLNQALSHKQGEAELLQLELLQAKDAIARLEEVRTNLEAGQKECSNESMVVRNFSPAAADLRISEMEMAKEELQVQLLQKTSATASLQEECEVLYADLNQSKQEASAAVAESSKMSSELAVSRERIMILEEENQMLKNERDNYQENVSRLEMSLHNFVSKNEEEALLRCEDLSAESHEDSFNGQKLTNDVHTLQQLIYAKEKEYAAMMDKARSQEQELKSIERKCELLHCESKQSRQDVSRMAKEIVLKMREITATMEINRVLLRNQASMQRKMSSLETQLEQEKERVKCRKAKVNEVIRKIENSERAQVATSMTLQEKNNIISDQEMSLQQLTHDLELTEKERDELEVKVNSLFDDVQNLSKANNACERKLETKDATINEKLLLINKQNEEIASLHHLLESLKHEQTLLLRNLSTERKAQELLKEDIKTHQESKQQLNEKLAELTGDLEIQKGKLMSAKETIEQARAEKEIVEKDYHNACRHLGEKETMLQTLHMKYVEDVTLIRQEAVKQSQAIGTERDLGHLKDQNVELQDIITRKEVIILDLKDQLHSKEELGKTQVTDMQHTIDGMRSLHEYERKTLREAHNEVEENLKARVQEVENLASMKHQLTDQAHDQERRLGEINCKLIQEVTGRKLAEEKLELLKEALEDLKKKASISELTVADLQTELKKADTDCIVERKRNKHLTSQVKSLELALSVSESALKAAEERIDNLKSKLMYHQQQTQVSTSKVHKLDQEFKQQVESQEEENVRLRHQVHQLQVELEHGRENLALKNKDNFRLQERVLEVENKLREEETRLRQTQDFVRRDTEMKTGLGYRFEELETELKKLRIFLEKKSDGDEDGKGMWQEINRVISGLAKQFHFHLETSKLLDKGNQNDSHDLIHKLRRSLLESEYQLNTERALHAVTRNSVQALEEDCSRLRQTIVAIRRNGSKTEKKHKSHMEEINEIIARSQTRAQALLASGEHSACGSLHDLNPSQDYNCSDTNFSTDTTFVSDVSFLNLSGTHSPFPPSK